MKKILLMAVAAFTIAFTSNAQTQGQGNSSQREVRDHSRKMQYANLELTQAQKDQLKQMREANKANIMAIKSDKSLTEAQKSEKIKAMHKSQRNGMKSVFTKEQKEKMQAQRKDQSSKKGVRNQSRKSSLANLDLTQVQKDQLKKMKEATKVQKEAIKKDPNLSEAQKGEKMKELHKSQKEKMNTVLTKNQQEKMKTLRKDHKMKGKGMRGHKKSGTSMVS